MNKHILECLEEEGREMDCFSSNHVETYKGIQIESFYNENSNSPFAWTAFAMGYGSEIGACREEAVAELKKTIDTKGKMNFPLESP